MAELAERTLASTCEVRAALVYARRNRLLTVKLPAIPSAGARGTGFAATFSVLSGTGGAAEGPNQLVVWRDGERRTLAVINGPVTRACETAFGILVVTAPGARARTRGRQHRAAVDRGAHVAGRRRGRATDRLRGTRRSGGREHAVVRLELADGNRTVLPARAQPTVVALWHDAVYVRTATAERLRCKPPSDSVERMAYRLLDLDPLTGTFLLRDRESSPLLQAPDEEPPRLAAEIEHEDGLRLAPGARCLYIQRGQPARIALFDAVTLRSRDCWLPEAMPGWGPGEHVWEDPEHVLFWFPVLIRVNVRTGACEHAGLTPRQLDELLVGEIPVEPLLTPDGRRRPARAPEPQLPVEPNPSASRGAAASRAETLSCARGSGHSIPISGSSWAIVRSVFGFQ